MLSRLLGSLWSMQQGPARRKPRKLLHSSSASGEISASNRKASDLFNSKLNLRQNKVNSLKFFRILQYIKRIKGIQSNLRLTPFDIIPKSSSHSPTSGRGSVAATSITVTDHGEPFGDAFGKPLSFQQSERELSKKHIYYLHIIYLYYL